MLIPVSEVEEDLKPLGVLFVIWFGSGHGLTESNRRKSRLNQVIMYEHEADLLKFFDCNLLGEKQIIPRSSRGGDSDVAI